jgi:RHS repeat-associated protein
VQDPNNGTTRYRYDAYGRVTSEDYPGPGSKSITYRDTARPRYTVTAVTDGTTTYAYMDGLDRPLQATVSSAAGREITSRTYYDNAGRVTKTAGPFFTSGYGYYTGSTPSGAPYRDITAFDFLNRPRTIVSAGDSGTATTRIAYSGFNRTVTDPDGKSTTENRDYLGRIQSIRDADDNTTTYDYTGADDMTQVRDAAGNRITMTRNTLGHIALLDDPDLGRWYFSYQAGGEVKTRQDEKGQTITFWYNDRNQLTSKTYTNESPEEPDVSLTYDSASNGNGRLYQVTKGNATITYLAYDDMGRITGKRVTIDGVDYPFSYSYDAAGNLTSIEHPDGYTVNYSYHSNSNLIASVWASGPDVDVDISDYNNFEKPGRITNPAFSTDIGYYDRTGRVRSIVVPGMMSLSYTYSRAGDVLSINDTVRNFAYTYGYDDLHRLTRETASGPFKLPESRDINLYYEGTEAHAVSRVVTDQGERNLIYEDNGNLTIGYDFSKPGEFPERRLAYNAENMPLTLEYEPEGGAVTAVAFTYDGHGRRVKKESGGNTVIYVDPTYEIRNGQPVKYIFAGNQRVAKVVGSTVRYYHKDHLGSSAIVTDTSGNMLESLVYEAYGQPRATCALSSGDMAYTYTDQEWDAESGLYNYDARLYDPVLGRFLSADSVVPDWYDPQGFDRYAYGRNNPLVFIDPDGHAFWEKVPGTIAAGANYFASGISYVGFGAAAGIIYVVDGKESAARAMKEANQAFKVVINTQNDIAKGGIMLDQARAVAQAVSDRKSSAAAKETEHSPAPKSASSPKPQNVKVITDPDTAQVMVDKFKGNAQTRPIVDRKTGEVVGEITTEGPTKVIRTPHVDKGTPQQHWNLENKETGLNVHVVQER